MGLPRTEQDTTARVTLEIDAGARAPRGALTTAEGRQLSFSGWAELAGAIEEIRGGSQRSSASESDRELGGNGSPLAQNERRRMA